MSTKHHGTHNPFSRRPYIYCGTGKTILIVTEGKETEPQYLRRLRKELRLVAADIIITNADGTDPVSVVDYAIELRDKRKYEVRRGRSVPYDSVWAVLRH